MEGNNREYPEKWGNRGYRVRYKDTLYWFPEKNMKWLGVSKRLEMVDDYLYIIASPEVWIIPLLST